MLQSLTIRNIVLIENLTIRFEPGMQVLTGETGSGKSLLLNSLNLILGGRADRGQIRTGSEKASVEAVFDVPGNREVEAILAREQIEYDGSTVTLYREITAGGKHFCRVCGVMVSAALLNELATLLMDIHGQHETRFLMDPEMHMRFLDRMGDPEHQILMKQAEETCNAFLTVHRHYARLRKENDQKQRGENQKQLFHFISLPINIGMSLLYGKAKKESCQPQTAFFFSPSPERGGRNSPVDCFGRRRGRGFGGS